MRRKLSSILGGVTQAVEQVHNDFNLKNMITDFKKV